MTYKTDWMNQGNLGLVESIAEKDAARRRVYWRKDT